MNWISGWVCNSKKVINYKRHSEEDSMVQQTKQSKCKEQFNLHLIFCQRNSNGNSFLDEGHGCKIYLSVSNKLLWSTFSFI